LSSLCEQHLQGWPTQAAEQPGEAELARTKERARSLGSAN
jgi:hypothetical protein